MLLNNVEKSTVVCFRSTPKSLQVFLTIGIKVSSTELPSEHKNLISSFCPSLARIPSAPRTQPASSNTWFALSMSNAYVFNPSIVSSLRTTAPQFTDAGLQYAAGTYPPLTFLTSSLAFLSHPKYESQNP